MIPAHILCNPNPETALSSATDSESPTPLGQNTLVRMVGSDCRKATARRITVDAGCRTSVLWPSVQKDSEILAKRISAMDRVRAAQEQLAKTFERAA